MQERFWPDLTSFLATLLMVTAASPHFICCYGFWQATAAWIVDITARSTLCLAGKAHTSRLEWRDGDLVGSKNLFLA